MAKINLTAPEGMSGLAVEPWAKGEIYAVAADWAQASCPVRVYGRGGWKYDGRQVADFRHRPLAALESVLIEAVSDSGDDPDTVDIAAILATAEELDT